MRPQHNSIIVQIDKKKQKAWQEKKGSIYLPPAYLYMERYLQYGTITHIGASVKEYDPGIEIGDTAIFHHTVEDNKNMLVQVLEGGDELRALNAIPHEVDHAMNCQLYGYVKEGTGELCAYSTNLFIDANLEPLVKRPNSSRLTIPDIELDGDYFKREMDLLTRHRKSLETSMVNSSDYKYQEDIERQLNNMTRQQDKLSELSSAPRLVNATVVSCNLGTGIHPGEKVLVDKEILYPISVGGVSYFIARAEYVEKYDLELVEE